jgi:hypothetical protein
MEKQIKVTAAVDPSFDKAIARVDQLIAKFKELAAVSKEAGGGFGNILGLGNNRAIPGTGAGSPGRRVQAQTQQVGVGGVDNLVKSAQAFKGAGDAAKTALKGMSDAFREHVGVSTREGQKLVKELSDIEKSLERVASKAAKLKGMPGGLSRLMPDASHAERESIMPSWRSRLNSMMRGGGPASDLTAEESASIQGPLGRLFRGSGGNSWWNKAIPGTPELPGSAGSGLGKLMGNLGFKGGSTGMGVAGAVAAVGAAVNYAMEQRQEQQLAALEYQTKHQPFVGAQRSATLGQVFGGNALAIRQGDLSRSMALTGLAKDKNFLGLLGNQRAEFQKFIIDKQTPTEFFQNPTAGNAWNLAKNWIGSKASRAVDFIGGAEIPGLSTQQANEIRNRMQKDFLATRAPEDMQKMLELKMQQDPVHNQLMNELYGGAIGDLSLSRAARISGGVGRRRDGTPFDTVKMFEARAAHGGFGSGELAGMIGQIGGVGWGLGGGAAERLLSAQHGGLGNAVQLYGLGAQFGGGTARGAGRFFSGLQGMIGRGGVDVTAGAQIFGAGEGAMTAGNFSGFGAGGGLGFMQTLADATMSGTAGGDMLRARQVQGGLGALGNVASGGVDPLQQALNMSAALKAMPGGSYAAHRALMDMDPATSSEILRTGKLPDWMESSGVKFRDVKAFIEAQGGASMVARIPDKMVKGTALEGTLSRFREAGGVGYIKSLKGEDREREISRVSRLYNLSGMGTLDATKGMVRLQLARAGGPVARGRGAHQSVSGDSARAEAAGKAGEFLENEANVLGAEDAATRAGIGAMKKTYDAAEGARKTGQRFAGAEDPDQAIAGVAVALEQFVKSLRNVAGPKPPARGGPPKP